MNRNSQGCRGFPGKLIVSLSEFVDARCVFRSASPGRTQGGWQPRRGMDSGYLRVCASFCGKFFSGFPIQPPSAILFLVYTGPTFANYRQDGFVEVMRECPSFKRADLARRTTLSDSGKVGSLKAPSPIFSPSYLHSGEHKPATANRYS